MEKPLFFKGYKFYVHFLWLILKNSARVSPLNINDIETLNVITISRADASRIEKGF